MLDAIGWAAGNSAARKAADAVKDGNNQAIGTIGDYYDKGAAGYQPYLQYGQGAGGLGGLQGLAGGDYSGFMNSPDFKARTMFANQQFNDGAAAKYRLFSGGAQNDRDELNQNLAAQGLGDYRQFLQWGAGMGQQSANGLAALGASAGRGIAELQKDTGLAMAGKQSAYGNNAGGFLSSQTQKLGSMFGGFGGGWG